jgi:6-phosphogluconolactonase
MALSGGTTPVHLYEHLAGPQQIEAIPWQNAQIFFGDERDVSPDQPDSNYRRAEEALLGRVPVRFENVHPMPADATDLDLAARQYADLITQIVPPGPGGVPAFDLILLGVGGDGHTASLFPGTPALDEQKKLVVAQYVPVLGRHRMTFTYPLINAADVILFLITGMDKAEAVAQVLSSDPNEVQKLPAGCIQPSRGKIIYVLDAEAASRTQYRPGRG